MCYKSLIFDKNFQKLIELDVLFLLQPSKLIDSIKSMRDFEAELTLKESQLNSLRIDASDAEIVGHLKGNLRTVHLSIK